MSEELKKNLREMAQLTVLAHRISETQEYNLKMAPFVYFDKVKEAKVDYDLGHGIDEEKKEIQHRSFVTYYLTLDESANDKDLQLKFTAIENVVRVMFWKDIKVQVHFNEKLVYESKDVK